MAKGDYAAFDPETKNELYMMLAIRSLVEHMSSYKILKQLKHLSRKRKYTRKLNEPEKDMFISCLVELWSRLGKPSVKKLMLIIATKDIKELIVIDKVTSKVSIVDINQIQIDVFHA